MRRFDIVTIVDNLGAALTPAIVVGVHEAEGAEPSLDLVAPLIVGDAATSHTYKGIAPLESDPSGFYRWVPWDAAAFDSPAEPTAAASGEGSGDSGQGSE